MNGKDWDKPHELREPFGTTNIHSVKLSPLASRTAFNNYSPALPGFVYNKAETLSFIAEIFSEVLKSNLSSLELRFLEDYQKRAKFYAGGAQRIQEAGMSFRDEKNWKTLLDGALQNILCGLVMVHKTVIKSKNKAEEQKSKGSRLVASAGWGEDNIIPPTEDIEDVVDEEGLDPDMIDEVLDQIDPSTHSTPSTPSDADKEEPAKERPLNKKGSNTGLLIAVAAAGGLLLFSKK